MAQLDAQASRQLYEVSSFLVLDDLPAGSTFGIDGSAWSVGDRFRGLKVVPPGLHLLIASSSSSNSQDAETISAGIGVRHALLHFVKPQEVLLRRWDEGSEAFERPRKRRKTQSCEDVEQDLVDKDHLKSIDGNLAPYPFDKLTRWKSLTTLVDEACVGRVMGFDQRGDAFADALMGATGDADGAAAGSGRRLWGKSRDSADMDDAPAEIDDELLRYADFDLKRSWRAGAIGEEITRDSRDKSRLLLDVVDAQLSRNAAQLLAEIQLAFVLFAYVHSFSSLEAYKRLISLICRSQSALTDPRTTTLPLRLLDEVLPPQISLLQNDAHAHDLVELDAFFIDELSALRAGLKSAGRHKELQLRTAWSKLTSLANLELGALDEAPSQPKRGVHRYDLLKVNAEESDEDEDDKPQVVLDVPYDEAETPSNQPDTVEGIARPARQYWRDLDADDEVDIRL